MTKKLILLMSVFSIGCMLECNDNMRTVIAKGALTATSATATIVCAAGMVYCLYDIAENAHPADLLEPIRVLGLSVAAAGCATVATITGCGTYISGISLRSAIQRLLYQPKVKCDV